MEVFSKSAPNSYKIYDSNETLAWPFIPGLTQIQLWCSVVSFTPIAVFGDAIGPYETIQGSPGPQGKTTDLAKYIRIVPVR